MQTDFPIEALNRLSNVVDSGTLAPDITEALRTVSEYCWKARAQQTRFQVIENEFGSDRRFLSEPLMDQVKTQFGSIKGSLEQLGQQRTSGIMEKLIISHEALSARCIKLVQALLLYADPVSYRTGGAFSQDNSRVVGSYIKDTVPGRLARQTLLGDESASPDQNKTLQLAAA